MSIPQLKILEKNLSRICRAEAGKNEDGSDTSEGEDKHMPNRLAMTGTIKMLKEKTGKDSFTMSELDDPTATLKKYKKD